MMATGLATNRMQRLRRRAWRWMLAAFSVLLTAVIGLGATPLRAEAPQLVIVFDGSGSMWGPVDGTSLNKLSFMRKELGRSLGDKLPGVAVGLTTFGAQTGASCSASRAVFAPAPGQLGRLDAALTQFNPQGRGPLVLGLKTALASIDPASGSTRLLVVHDGLDNCGQDLCAFARELGAKKKRIAVDVLSLGLKPSQKGRMSCLTEATGGQLVEARSADEAIKGLDRIVLAMQSDVGDKQEPSSIAPKAPATPQPQKPSAPNAQKSSGLTLSAELAKSGKPIATGIVWHIVSRGAPRSAAAGKSTPHFDKRFRQPTVDQALAPGDYLVTMQSSTARLEKTVEVRDGERQSLTFTFDGGLVDVEAGGEAQQPDTLVSITRRDGGSGAQEAVWSGPIARARGLLLPAGVYLVSSGNGLAKYTAPVNVSTGTAQKTRLGTTTAKLVVEAKGLRPEQRSAVRIRIAVDDPTNPGSRRTIAQSAAPTATFALPAGPYEITLSVFDVQTTEIVVLAAGQTTTHAISLAQMALRVASHVGTSKAIVKDSLRYRVWRSGQLDRPIAVSRAAQPVFHLAPGKYRIESRIGHQNAVMLREFVVKRGAFGSLELRHKAGHINFALPTTVSGSPKNAYWEISDADGRLVWRTFNPAPSVTLKAGTYQAIVDMDGKRQRAKFAVVAGHTQTVIPGAN